MPRDPLQEIAEDLKADEGWRPHVYLDHLGFETIGFGFLVDQRRGGGMPAAVGDYWLNWAVDKLWARLELAIPWFESAPAPVQRALVNLAYQVGVSGLLRFRKTLALGAEGKWADMADEALRSRWATQTPARAKRVTDWIRSAA